MLELFNEIKQRVEDATNWRSLYQTTTVTLAASTGFGAAGGGYFVALPGTNKRSRVARGPIRGAGMTQAGYAPAIMPSDKVVPLVFDTTSPTTSGYFALYEMPLNQLLFNLNRTNWATQQQPQFFAIGPSNLDNNAGNNTVDQQVLYVYPPVSTQRTLTVTMVNPQSEFTTSLQDVNNTPYVFAPGEPIVAGLKWRAYEERGEELGPSNAFSEADFEDVLADAVGIENMEGGNNLDLVLI